MHLGRSSTDARPPTHCSSGNSLDNATDAALCRRWRDHHDISAARQLAKRHRGLVVQLARIYRVSGLSWNDLAGEGQLGLMRALCRFDPDQGVGFATYATWQVAITLQTYVLSNLLRAFGGARVGNNHLAERQRQSSTPVCSGDPASHSINFLPRSVMSADNMIDAAPFGFNRGEDVTIPSLADSTDWDRYEVARRAKFNKKSSPLAVDVALSRIAVSQRERP